MADEKYNGWTNWETWALNLHLTNDEGTYNDILEFLRGIKGDSYDRGQQLREYIEENYFNDSDGENVARNNLLLQDIIGGFMSSVNFEEIVEGLKEEIEDLEDEDKELDIETKELIDQINSK